MHRKVYFSIFISVINFFNKDMIIESDNIEFDEIKPFTSINLDIFIKISSKFPKGNDFEFFQVNIIYGFRF